MEKKKYQWLVVVNYDYADKKRGDIISRHYSYDSALKNAQKSTFWAIKEANNEHYKKASIKI